MEKAKIVEQLKLDAQSIRGDYGENVSFNVKKRTGDKISDDYKCIRCGTRGKHFAHDCFAIKLTCKSCGKKGHIAKACISNKIKSVEQETNASDIFDNEIINDDNVPTNKIGHVLRIPKNTRKPHQTHTWSKNASNDVETNVNQYPVYKLTTPSQPRQIVSAGLSNQTHDKRSFNVKKHNNVNLRKHTGDFLHDKSDISKTYTSGENVSKHMGDDMEAYTCTEDGCDCDSFLY